MRFDKDTFKLNGKVPRLTRDDCTCPPDCMGIYSLVRNPINSAVYMTENACQSMRVRTYDAILLLCKQYNTPNFAELFNYNAQVFGEVGLNFFAQDERLAPISGIIQCFTTQSERKKTLYISFGISKKLLRRYFNTGICPVIKWSPETTKDAVIFGVRDIKFFADKVIKVDRSALYRKYEKWCNARNISEADGVMMAIDLLMKKFPADSQRGLGEYDPITLFDRKLFHDAPRGGPPEKRSVSFSGTILEQSKRIIDRWNRDPENAARVKMDFDTYCNNALALLNRSVPTKYIDPQLFYEYLKKNSKKV